MAGKTECVCVCVCTKKETIDLASHWPCITDISGHPPFHLRAQVLEEGDEHPPISYALLWSTERNGFCYIVIITKVKVRDLYLYNDAAKAITCQQLFRN